MINQDDKIIRVCMITLGCSKNLVDAECMTRILMDNRYEMVLEPIQAQVIIVNTCGFIESAKQEAINTILEMAEYKTSPGICDFLIVTGCLAQRYDADIRESIPEVDQVIGTAHYQDIAKAIGQLYGVESDLAEAFVDEAGSLSHMRVNRVISTVGYAWLKIAEGCSNRCSYCAIPMIRGPYRSRAIEELIDEAVYLTESGYSEIILTAQDTTSYGLDLYGQRRLPELLRRLSQIDKLRLIRIMYSYSDGITPELIHELSYNPKVAHYLDMPIQHGDDVVLQRMKRRDTAESISDVLRMLREAVPDIILRTTVLVGFPGETEESFHNLLTQLKLWQFDRLGCFVFSPEEDTAAFTMSDPVEAETALERHDQVMELQQEISLLRNQARVGSIVQVAIESISDDGIFYVGRSFGEAPEVDPVIYVVATKEPLSIGQICAVRLVDCSAYDLTAETVD